MAKTDFQVILTFENNIKVTIHELDKEGAKEIMEKIHNTKDSYLLRVDFQGVEKELLVNKNRLLFAEMLKEVLTK